MAKHIRFVMFALFGLLQIGLIACDSLAYRRRQLESVYPPDRATAAVRLAEAGDREAIHKLVDLLEDDDAGVRLYVSLALERLCHQTYGFRYYDSESQRAEAVRRWRQALRDGQVIVQTPMSNESPPTTGALDLSHAAKDSTP